MWDWLRRFLTDERPDDRPAGVFPDTTAPQSALATRKAIDVTPTRIAPRVSAEVLQKREERALLERGRIKKEQDRKSSTARGNLVIADLFADDVRRCTLAIEQIDRWLAVNDPDFVRYPDHEKEGG